MCWGMYLCYRYHVPNPTPIRLDCMSHQVHACFHVDVAHISLLQNNVEVLDISGQNVQAQRLEYQAKLGNSMACMTVMVI